MIDDVLLTLGQPDFAGQTRTQTRLGVEGARQIRHPTAKDGLVSPEPWMAGGETLAQLAASHIVCSALGMWYSSSLSLVNCSI